MVEGEAKDNLEFSIARMRIYVDGVRLKKRKAGNV